MLVIAGLPLLIGFYRSLSPETVALSRTLVLDSFGQRPGFVAGGLCASQCSAGGR